MLVTLTLYDGTVRRFWADTPLTGDAIRRARCALWTLESKVSRTVATGPQEVTQ